MCTFILFQDWSCLTSVYKNKATPNVITRFENTIQVMAKMEMFSTWSLISKCQVFPELVYASVSAGDTADLLFLGQQFHYLLLILFVDRYFFTTDMWSETVAVPVQCLSHQVTSELSSVFHQPESPVDHAVNETRGLQLRLTLITGDQNRLRIRARRRRFGLKTCGSRVDQSMKKIQTSKSSSRHKLAASF